MLSQEMGLRFKRGAADVATGAANRFRGSNGQALASLRRRGQPEDPASMERRAAMLQAQERVKATGHPSLSGGSPGEQLALQAQARKAEDAFAYGEGAGALRDERNVDVNRHQPEGLAGFQTVQKYNPVDMATLSQGMVMAGNQARGGTFGQMASSPQRGTEMSGQGLRQLDATIADQQARQQKLLEQQMAQANADAARVRERQRIATEGDAWLASMQQQPQTAVSTLARRR